MGKTGKWIRSFLTGKKEKDKCTTDNNSASAENPEIPISQTPTAAREKRRWSFGRSLATAAAPTKGMNSAESTTVSKPESEQASFDLQNEEKKHTVAVAAATAAAAAAAAVVIRLSQAAEGRTSEIEETAAIKIQSVFRSYLARKALRALKGLVKLQALVRGHLVRKQANTTLRCMQALMTAQARAGAQRIRMKKDGKPAGHKQSIHRKSTQENRYMHSNYDIDRGMEENVKIVEIDLGQSKGNTKSRFSYSNNPETEHRISALYESSDGAFSKPGHIQASFPASALTETSPNACSGQFEDYSFSTAQNNPQHYNSISKPDPFSSPRPDYAEPFSYDYPLYPNYMANTESSRAKVRSQSAPKQRLPDTFERQPSRRKPSMESRIVPRGMKMQRSSSATGQKYQHPWSIKLDRSTVSLIESECGSTSTVLTNATYCRTLVGFDA